MRAYIYLNEGEGHFDGFDPVAHADKLTLVARTGAVTDRHTLSFLDDIYTELNVGGTYLGMAELYRDNENRSLSVGDVVLVQADGSVTGFACAGTGWEPVDVEALALRTKLSL